MRGRLVMITLVAALALVRSARAGPADDWTRALHRWVAARWGAFDGAGHEEGSLESNLRNGFGGPFSMIGVGYRKQNGAELAAGESWPLFGEKGIGAFEVQALYAQAPVDAGGDSLLGPGDVPLANATVHFVGTGAGSGVRVSYPRFGPLGDGAAIVGLLVGVAWMDGASLTPTATALGVERLETHTRFAWALDGRLDQRFYRGVVGSLGFRLLSARNLLSLVPGSGSIYRRAEVSYTIVQPTIGIAYWF